MKDFIKYLPVIALAVGAVVALWILSKRKPVEQIQDPLLSGNSQDLINTPTSITPEQHGAISDVRSIPRL